jgi:hypothetical protein
MKEPQRFFRRIRFQWVLPILVILVMGLVVAGTAAQDETPLPQDIIVEQTFGVDSVDTVRNIQAEKDAFVSSSNPYTNYGGLSTLRSGRDSGYGATRTLIQFSLGSIPQGAVINNATLYVYQNQATPPGDAPFKYGARYLNSSWNEGSVTFSSHQPEWGSVFGEVNIDGNVGWKTFNVTELVHTWVSGERANYGMLIQSSNENLVHERIFTSKDASSNRPYIIVDYTEYVDNCPPSAWFTPSNNFPSYSLGSFTVSWDASDCGSNGNPPSGIRNWDVQYSTDNSNWINWKMDTRDKSGTFYGVNGQIYYFRVRAVDNSMNFGSYVYSTGTTVDSTPPTNLSLQLTPTTNVDGKEYAYPHFQVTWFATDNLSGVQKYIVEWNDNAGSGWQSREFPVGQTTEWVNGLGIGKTYTFRMHAVDNVGNVSDWIYAPNVTIVSDPVSFVLPFDNAITTSLTFDVSWVGFTSSSSGIEGFYIKYQVDGGDWEDWYSNVISTTATFDATSLFSGEIPPRKAKVIGFEVSATTADLPQEAFKGVAEATIVVDPDNTMTNITYMPIVAKN